jgi:hypothetical protein
MVSVQARALPAPPEEIILCLAYNGRARGFICFYF